MGTGLKTASLKPSQRQALVKVAQGGEVTRKAELNGLDCLGLVERAKRGNPWKLTAEGVEVARRLGVKI